MKYTARADHGDTITVTLTDIDGETTEVMVIDGPLDLTIVQHRETYLPYYDGAYAGYLRRLMDAGKRNREADK